MKPHIYHKKCKWCGKEFDTLSPRQVYCKDDYGECPICGKKVKIKDYFVGAQCCSKECRLKRIGNTCIERYGDACAVNSEHAREKARQTCLRKYGVDYYSKTKEFTERFVKTCNERYGVSYPLQSEEIKKKTFATNMGRYGGKNPMSDPEVVKKARATFEEHYGDESSNAELQQRRINTWIERYGGVGYASDIIRDQINATLLERYGTTNVQEVDSVRQKTIETNLHRYGSTSPFSSDEIRKHIAETNLQRYGSENVFASEEIKERIRQSILEKYGVECTAHIDGVQERRQQTNLERYGAENYTQSVEGIERMILDQSKLDEWLSFKEDMRSYILCKFQTPPTLEQLASVLGVHPATISHYVNVYKLQDLIQYRPLRVENEIIDFIKSILPDTDILLHSRKLISPYEIDIYLPEYKFGIECNPTYTHNSSFGSYNDNEKKPINYHRNKSDLAFQNNIFLFHIFGWEWSHRQDQIKSIIRNILNKNDCHVYARKTTVVKLDSKTCSEFLECNHLQGSTNASIRLGLMYENELVSVMTFNRVRGTIGSKKTNESDVFELSRFCSKLNTSVVGGASKLFKYFIDNYSFDSIISFSDYAHTRGSLYKTLGFEIESISNPCYCWVNLKDDTMINRLSSQKSHISKLFPDESIDTENMTERQIMEEHGYAKVYDCGKVRYVYKR